MSDYLIKTLLESLTPEQKQELVEHLLGDVSTENPAILAAALSASLTSYVRPAEVVSGVDGIKVEFTKPAIVVNKDFSVTRNDESSNRRAAVRAKKNKWSDDGTDRDPNFDPDKFEKMGRTQRARPESLKAEVACHICSKKFKVNPSLVYGENIRCNRCTGR